MCRWDTQGYKYGCGHYVLTEYLGKYDCNRSDCTWSRMHPARCRNCECNKFRGPDMTETVLGKFPQFCNKCEHWFPENR